MTKIIATRDQAMRWPDESEELKIDRLLQELGIRLPEVESLGDTILVPMPDMDAAEDRLPRSSMSGADDLRVLLGYKR